MKRWLKYTLAAALIAGVGAIVTCSIASIPFFIAQAKRDAHSKRAFLPLSHLYPLVLDNGFGVYHIQFDSHSKLTDENAAELLSLNKLPGKYDLSLWLMTSTVTDASIPVLSKLKTTDTIVLDGAGITERGIAELASSNSNLQICSPKGINLAPR